MPLEPIICRDLDDLSQQAARFCLQRATESVADHGCFFIALAGGSTPKRLYQTLSQAPYLDQWPWSQTHVYFGDERSVPCDHADSNVRMAGENLLHKVPIPKSNVHVLHGDLSHLRQSAADYEQDIRRHLPRNPQGMPQFDLILLGMGDDGHTASLFPNTCILHESQRWVAANFVPQLNTWRVSMTLPLINNASHVALLVAGADKQQRLREIFTSKQNQYPVQAVRAHQQTLWFLDQTASALLNAD